LANLYLKEQLYDNAAYCFEELILVEPHNFHYYVKYAEIKYSISEYPLALKYFSYALELSKENNISAFYGVIMTTNKLGKLSKEESEIQEWSISQILNMYKGDDKEDIIKACTSPSPSQHRFSPPEPVNEKEEYSTSKPQTQTSKNNKKAKKKKK